MAKLIYSMLASLDGYTADGHCDFGWGAPEAEELPLLNVEAYGSVTRIVSRVSG